MWYQSQDIPDPLGFTQMEMQLQSEAREKLEAADKAQKEKEEAAKLSHKDSNMEPEEGKTNE